MKEECAMGFGDLFKAKENQQLKDRIAELEALLTPEMSNLIDINHKIAEQEKVLLNNTQKINIQNAEISRLNNSISEKNKEIVTLDDEILIQSFGLYKPRYDLQRSEDYKAKLDYIRNSQKQMIKNKTAVTGNSGWTVNGSKSEGNKMVSDMQKLLLRAFNNECDDLIGKVKYNNYEASIERINKSCEAISKLGRIMSVSITNGYKNLKIEELTLAFEYAQKKQEEKEEQKALKAQMREEAKLQKEIEEERKKLEKEQAHYLNALAKLNLQLSNDPENQDLLQKKQELEVKAEEIDKSIKDVDYREANKRAGYVYVISNIGAFGENVYKIGMTRRLDPMERVDELGDASVPFDFDVHAMIFTDDAPALEAALHKAFEDKKVNMVNQRREFFNVTLDEIKAVVKANYDKTVEFVDIPDAEQYRVSMKMKQGQSV